MRTKMFQLIAMALMVIAITGCDKVSDLNTVTFDADFAASLDCSTAALKSTAENHAFSGTAVIDPTSDTNVSDYLNNIKKYEVEAIHATITSISQENVTVFSATLDVFNAGRETGWTMTNELLTTGKTITLGNENGQWDTVSEILKDGQVFTVQINGEADTGGVTFTLRVRIETKVEAKVL
ncbi:MAG: hypothetical protein RBS55_10290 [Bacteroidales bacterium]|jgi:hypothetical protein|nr:hypothetical protein [Bacteroidales bacterium]